MKVIAQKYIISFLACLLLLSGLTVPARAHPCTPGHCGPCRECIGGHCICVEECCHESDCPDVYCYDCIACDCVAVIVVAIDSFADCTYVGDYIVFLATTYPPNHGSQVQWSAPGGHPSSETGGTLWTYWDTPGLKTVTASLCGSSMEKQVNICDASKSCCGSICYDLATDQCCRDTIPPYLCSPYQTCCKGNCCWEDFDVCCDGKCVEKCLLVDGEDCSKMNWNCSGCAIYGIDCS